MNRLKSIKMKAGQKSSDTRLPKPPKPPEKPLMPYMRYSRKVWESVKNANPLLKLWEVGKIIGQMWRELPENEKSHFIEEYENDKIQYNDALRMYHNSPAYKSWLLHKEKLEKSFDDSDSLDGMSQTQFFKQKERIVKDPHSVETRESYILEDNDEDPDEVFTVKHVAAQRFQRNHKFMLDLFSDFKIPELGAIVTESRLNSLKQQVSGLLIHKRKLDEEINDWDKKHDSKKLKIKVESEGFWSGYNKELEARPVITEIMFSEMVKRARDDIIREEKERDEFIKTRLIASERKPPLMDQSSDCIVKSDSNAPSVEPMAVAPSFDNVGNQYSNNTTTTSIPNPFTASVVNKSQGADTQVVLGPPAPVTNYPSDTQPHQNILPPSFNNPMLQRSHNMNPYDNRSQVMNYGYGQQPTPSNPMTNYPGRYPQPPVVAYQQSSSSSSSHSHSSQYPPTQMSQRSHISRSNMISPTESSAINELDQKPPKLNKGRESQSPIIDKEMYTDSKNSISKDKCETSFSPPKITDSQNCPPNISLSSNLKAPILSPKIDSDSKLSFHDNTSESPVSIQSPPKKPSTKKRKPPTTNKSKTAPSISQQSDNDAMNCGQILSGDNPGSGSLNNPSHMGSNPKIESGYPGDGNFSQMPIQQGLYPYHYYPPQFVPRGHSPAQYGSPYQQGFSQPNYYNQMPQPYRQITAPHQMQQATENIAVNQYAMQHKPVPQNQPYPTNPYGPGGYGNYGPQYPSGQSFPHSNNPQMSDQPSQSPQVMTNKDMPISQSAPMPTHMTAPEDSVKYQNDAPVSCAPSISGYNNSSNNSGGGGGQIPSQYPSQSQQQCPTGMMQYTNQATSTPGPTLAVPTVPTGATGIGIGTHYPPSAAQGHYFYYPPPPQQQGASHTTAQPYGHNGPEHPSFWSSHGPGQSSSSASSLSSSTTGTYPSMGPTITDPATNDSHTPKVVQD